MAADKNGLDNLQLDLGLNYRRSQNGIIRVGTHGYLQALKIAPAGGRTWDLLVFISFLPHAMPWATRLLLRPHYRALNSQCVIIQGST